MYDQGMAASTAAAAKVLYQHFQLLLHPQPCLQTLTPQGVLAAAVFASSRQFAGTKAIHVSARSTLTSGASQYFYGSLHLGSILEVHCFD